MTRGLAQPIEIRGGKDMHSDDVAPPASDGMRSPVTAPTNKVIGVICAGDLALERDTVKDTIAKGLEQRPDAVWVCIEPKSDRLTFEVMRSLDIDPVVMPMNPYWKGDRNRWGRPFDERRTMRDCEMLSLCDELIVFHKRTSNSPWRERAQRKLELGLHQNLFVVEMGPEPKKRARKTRKPVGA